MSPVFAALDLVVIPSLSEGLPLVLLEALLHGKPIVATRVGGIPEVLSGELARWLVRAGDAETLAAAQVEALQSHSLRTKLGETGARYVSERFSPLRRAEHMLEVYRQVTMPGGSTRPSMTDLVNGHVESRLTGSTTEEIAGGTSVHSGHP
jgi:glycosyltransferase involved in cell wall biosynthesis